MMVMILMLVIITDRGIGNYHVLYIKGMMRGVNVNDIM